MKTAEIKDIAIALSVVFLGYKVAQALNFIPTKEEREQEKNLEKDLKEQERKQKPTKSRAEWGVIADSIYEALRYSAISDRKKDAFMEIMRVKNNTDFLLLQDVYGKRQLYGFGLPMGAQKNLVDTIKAELSHSYRTQINNSYANKGIKYRV